MIYDHLLACGGEAYALYEDGVYQELVVEPPEDPEKDAEFWKLANQYHHGLLELWCKLIHPDVDAVERRFAKGQ